ncbi:MAG: tyrosine-type recombinase/integrase [Solirubrobacteraceae bacterium]
MARPRDSQVRERTLSDGSIAYWAKLTVAVDDRRNVVLGYGREGMDRARAVEEIQRQKAAVTLGQWQGPPREEASYDAITFHSYSSEWLDRKRRELRPRTILDYEWRLTSHLLPFFAGYRLAEIDRRLVDRYREAKLKEREEIARRQEQHEPLLDAHGRPMRQLSNRSINMTIDLLSNILSEAVEHELISTNPAAGRRRRLKASAPRRTWLMPDEVCDLIDAAERIDRRNKPAIRERALHVQQLREQDRTLAEVAAELGLAISTTSRLARLPLDEPERSVRRAIIATLALAGPRAGELCALRWRDVNLAHRVLHAPGTKSDCAERNIKLLDRLRDELMRWKLTALSTALDDPVFPTSTGRQRDKDNLRERVLAPAVREANRDRQARGLMPLPSGLTPHSLRRTFISLLLASGRPVPYVQKQAGHRDARTTLNIYAQVIDTDCGAREQLGWLCQYSTEDSEPSTQLARTSMSPILGARER